MIKKNDKKMTKKITKNLDSMKKLPTFAPQAASIRLLNVCLYCIDTRPPPLFFKKKSGGSLFRKATLLTKTLFPSMQKKGVLGGVYRFI